VSKYDDLRAEVIKRFEGHDYDPNGPLVLVWHLHHDMLLEPLEERIANRIAWIIARKPESEIPIRLKWLRPVRGVLPNAVTIAVKRYEAAWKEYSSKWTQCGLAWERYKVALKQCNAELATLHDEECPGCPWDGETLVFKE